MSYDQTQRLGGQQPPSQPANAAGSTAAMGRSPEFPLPSTAFPQPPAAPAAQQTEIIRTAPTVTAWLVVTKGDRVGRMVTLSTTGTGIGRDAHNDVILDDTNVSRQHAKVRLETNAQGQEQFFLWDLASSNGTRLNGQAIVKQPLFDNDRIEIGGTVLVFKQIDGPQRVQDEPGEGSQAGEEGKRDG